jgi:hypothetical protein
MRNYDLVLEEWNLYEEQYFSWLIQLISNPIDGFDYEYWMTHYRLLLRHLYLTDFVATIAMDENRAVDGLYLRELYADETGDERVVDCCAQNECSMLEMMVALARRIENDIMDQNGPEGNRVYFWFNQMLVNSGLSEFDESEGMPNFDLFDSYIDTIINHRYGCDGSSGGLFYVDYIPERDFRETELWWQVQIWIRKYYDFESDYEILLG